MNATLSVADLEAQIHALSQEDKLRIARFVEREIGSPSNDDDDLPEWMKDELERREKLVAEGRMEMADADVVFARVRERLGFPP